MAQAATSGHKRPQRWIAASFAACASVAALGALGSAALNATNQDAAGVFSHEVGEYPELGLDILQQNREVILAEYHSYLQSQNASSVADARFVGGPKVKLATGPKRITSVKPGVILKTMEFYPPAPLQAHWESGELRSTALGLEDPVMEARYFPRTAALLDR